MKRAVGLLIAAVFMLAQTGAAWALTKSFTLTANVPAASGVSISVASFPTSGTPTFTVLPTSTSTLSFDTMTFNTENGIWIPDHAFAVDVGTQGGGGSVQTQVSYAEGNNPNGTTNGLGYKATASFMKTMTSGTTTVDSAIPAHGKKKLADLVSGVTVTPTQVSGGWLRVYLGIATGATGDPTGSGPFTNSDKSGDYTGVITFTATLQ